MPPQIGKANYSGEVREEQEGGFFSKIPLWIWIAIGLVLVYALWVKFKGGGGSSQNPLVTTQPTDTTPYNNLSAALSQILGNEQAIGSSLAAQASGNNVATGTIVPNAAQANAAQASYAVQTGTGMPYTASSQAIVSKIGTDGTSYDKVTTPPSAAISPFLKARTPIPIPSTGTPTIVNQPIIPSVWGSPSVNKNVPQSPGVQFGRPLRTGPQSF